MESVTLFVHIAAGVVAVVAGYLALFAAKGATLHRRAGTAFVYAMVTMGLFATAVAIQRGAGSLLGGPIAAYFVLSAVATVRPVERRYEAALCAFALVVALLCYAGAATLVAQGRGSSGGAPVPMIIFLASVLLLAGLGDLRALRAPPAGSRRIARHLWRMCFAFWIATGSFFLGQMDEFPAWLQKPALMAIPAMLPLVVMAYWLWRVRFRSVNAGAHEQHARQRVGPVLALELGRDRVGAGERA